MNLGRSRIEHVGSMGHDGFTSPFAPLDDSSLSFYTIGQVAELLGVAQPALRRLDGLDIVRPDRSEGGQRRYSRKDVNRLKEVFDLTGDGVTLAGVRMVLELRHRVNELEAEIARLRGLGAGESECDIRNAQFDDDSPWE